MSKGAVIFDFDGTLADSFALALQIFDEITGRKYALNDSVVQKMRGLPARAVIKELNIPWWKVPMLLFKGRRLMRQRLSKVKLFGGVEKVIQQLAQDNKLFLVSSNSTETVEIFLENYGLRSYFHKIYGGVGLFNKAKFLRRIINDNDLGVAKCFYVGDEVRDIQAARQTGVRTVSVTWGYNNRQALMAQQPFALVDRPEDLIATIQHAI